MQMPKPTAQHQKLEALAGTWTGEEKLHPSPWDAAGGAALGKWVMRMDLDGLFLIADYTQERGGKVNFRGHGVYSWDDKAQCYTQVWFDSMTMAPLGTRAIRGEWKGDALVYEHEMMPGARARYTFRLEGGRLVSLVENSKDGGKEWAPFMEGRYTRS